ncbi:MAG: MBL fold metallo-hydrolase [Proteobacteria bacterium]|nr:MBL fold metallo-hydrolase [Pseudomonadota bacterium]
MGYFQWINTAAVSALAIVLATCSGRDAPSLPQIGADPDLAAHTTEFRQEVIQVTDGVHVAVGFGLANSILLEGKDGVVIVDTMESVEAAAPVKVAFDKITSKPIKAIIYTHYHSDHTFGASVFADGNSAEIYAHENTNHHLNRIVNVTRDTTYRRAMRQFGVLLPKGGVLNAGIGPRLEFDRTKTVGVLPPSKTFSGERLELEVAGMKLELVHAPGETTDQIFVWMPEKRVLLAADNYYKSFPNLYAIRGTSYRDVTDWVRSLDKMRRLGPEHLVPSHTRPLTGAGVILETLTNYRDAIQFVHDQTIRWMNKGLTPDEIVERVKLPPHLATLPYLHEYYGTVAWSVRAIFNGYLGWFSGNATDLFKLPLKERAERFVTLAGGESELLARTREAVENKDYQWALELVDQLLALKPDLLEAREIKARALTALGERQIASTARHYYLTQALEQRDKISIGVLKAKNKTMAHNIPLDGVFESMAVKLDPVESADVDKAVGFRFPDTGETYMVHVRRGVAEIQPRFPEKPDIAITVDSTVWKEIVTGLRNPAAALLTDVEVEGGTLDFVRFLKLFKEE